MSKVYKAEFASNVNKKLFCNARVKIFISLGCHYYHGERLSAIIEEVNRRFSSCVILVCDTLNRHGMLMDMNAPLEQIHLKAQQMGKDWITENKKSLDLLTINHEIKHWDDWLFDIDYIDKLKIVKEFYNTRAEYKKIVDDFIYRYFERKNKDKLKYKITKKNFNHCLEYTLEESAAFLLQMEKAKCEFSFYATKDLAPIMTARDIAIEQNLDCCKYLLGQVWISNLKRKKENKLSTANNSQVCAFAL